MIKFSVLALSLSIGFIWNTTAQADVKLRVPAFSEKDLAKQNLKVGEQFLKENKKKPGIITVPSGLQYKIIKQGKGQKPTLGDFVKVHYRGTFIDGKEFDKSDREGAPDEIQVNATIPGFSEALQLMTPGSEWVIYIPANLAYGAEGIKDKIPPNSPLIFDIKLLSVMLPPDESMTGVLEELEED